MAGMAFISQPQMRRGIALAAIQSLNEKFKAENAGLRKDLTGIDARIAALESKH
jgi:hypothetical protein